MATRRKSGRERGGTKKPAGTAQGHRKPAKLEAVPTPDDKPTADVIEMPLEGEVVGDDDEAAAALAERRAGIADGVPTPPVKLGAVAAQAWSMFWGSPVSRAIVDSDRYALDRWIRNVEQLEECHELIGSNLTTEGSTKQVRLHPLFKRINELEDLIQRAEKKFGMTPLDRLGLGVVAGEHELTAKKINDLAKERKGNASSKPTKKPRALPAGGKEEDEFEAV